jgi:RsiW-degrading membrane proteinase PrsW (M82 family)
MNLRELLYDRFGRPRLVPVGALAFVAALALALLAIRVFSAPLTEEGRARALLGQGDAAAAEAIFAKRVQDAPSVPRVIELVETHRIAGFLHARKRKVPFGVDGEGQAPPLVTSAPMSDAALDAILAKLPPDVARVGRFLRGDETARAEIQAGAIGDPPMPWANHLLAREEEDEVLAANLYLREGRAYPDRADDLDAAIGLLVAAGAWDAVREEMQDPRVATALSPPRRYEVAVHLGDWGAAAKAFPGMWTETFHGPPLWLSLVAALAWGFFCTRLGRAADRPWFRFPLYFAAFALGVLSVVPTLALISVEEAKLHLVETGDLLRDAIFYVFGVGVREEGSKLLLFAFLLPVLRRWGDKLDVLACGALVGLGFAAEENVGYLAGHDLTMGLGRFLTANFLHMAMTGTLASALDDAVRDGDRHGNELFRTSLMVVGLHGAYDLLIDHPEIGGGYMAMVVFVVLTKKFLDTIDAARKKADRGLTPVHAFIVAVATVTGVTVAHAVDVVGPASAPLVLAGGLLGEAIMIVVFVRILSVL